jgi:hypothetical protein
VLAQRPLHDRGDLEMRIDGYAHPGEVTVALEGPQKFLQISESHVVSISPGLSGPV